MDDGVGEGLAPHPARRRGVGSLAAVSLPPSGQAWARLRHEPSHVVRPTRIADFVRVWFVAMLPIETARLRLRRFVPGDVAALHAIHSRDDVTRWLFWDPRSRGRGARRRSTAHIARPPEDGVVLAIERDGALIGTANLAVGEHRQGEIGFIAASRPPGPRLRDRGGRGDARARVRRATTCTASPGAWSRATRRRCRVLERLGMRKEAHLLENDWVKGEWSSEAVYAILARDGASGGGGIRTRGRVAPSPVFKTGAFDHSATPPGAASVTLVRAIARSPSCALDGGRAGGPPPLAARARARAPVAPDVDRAHARRLRGAGLRGRRRGRRGDGRRLRAAARIASRRAAVVALLRRRRRRARPSSGSSRARMWRGAARATRPASSCGSSARSCAAATGWRPSPRARASSRSAWCARSPSTSCGASATTRAAA